MGAGAGLSFRCMDRVDVEDMRRRCNAHHRWLQENPDAVTFGQAWADQNLDEAPREFDADP
jgi:hypothetical protein